MRYLPTAAQRFLSKIRAVLLIPYLTLEGAAVERVFEAVARVHVSLAPRVAQVAKASSMRHSTFTLYALIDLRQKVMISIAVTCGVIFEPKDFFVGMNILVFQFVVLLQTRDTIREVS